MNNTLAFNKNKTTSLLASLSIIIAALGLTYIPLPVNRYKVVVVSGTELQEPLKNQLVSQFEQANPHIDIELKFQGSQELANNYLDQKNDFNPTVLIPANQEIIQELNQKWKTRHSEEAFYQITPIAKTILVAIAWPERGDQLFPDGQFNWTKIEQGMQSGNWSKIGANPSWGSFDFVMTDPSRSNSGQLTMNLWVESKLTAPLDSTNASNPEVDKLFALVKRSVYQPPRSTDILLQEFIARGPNDADIATVYESVALNRWEQSGKSQGKPYKIYYLNPTIESISTAAIVKRNVDQGTAKAAQQFINFLTQPEQQAIFIQYGFRPVNTSIDLTTVNKSPWSQNIPGVTVNPPIKFNPPPNAQTINEIQRIWERVQ